MTRQIYIGINGLVAALDTNSGVELWRTELSTGMLSATGMQDVAVLDHADRVYAGCHGHLFCLNASDGQVLWHNELKGMGHNDVTLSIGGRSIQVMHQVHHHNS